LVFVAIAYFSSAGLQNYINYYETEQDFIATSVVKKRAPKKPAVQAVVTYAKNSILAATGSLLKSVDLPKGDGSVQKLSSANEITVPLKEIKELCYEKKSVPVTELNYISATYVPDADEASANIILQTKHEGAGALAASATYMARLTVSGQDRVASLSAITSRIFVTAYHFVKPITDGADPRPSVVAKNLRGAKVRINNHAHTLKDVWIARDVNDTIIMVFDDDVVMNHLPPDVVQNFGKTSAINVPHCPVSYAYNERIGMTVDDVDVSTYEIPNRILIPGASGSIVLATHKNCHYPIGIVAYESADGSLGIRLFNEEVVATIHQLLRGTNIAQWRRNYARGLHKLAEWVVTKQPDLARGLDIDINDALDHDHDD